ncbi:hypothetical protein CUMW_158300 [Citrus unshiu]|uniref:Uncharacterized protein n=1 Tax=Citrus unshiu TaxID=55188 RepID=A0A2H5PQJ6_CITUN|nr:hypothetical protein CUMW_158300 [Citrus unshiu]
MVVFEFLTILSGLLPNPKLETSVLSVCPSLFSDFGNEKEVVDHGTTMAPLVCLLVILESLKCVLSGVARGCGWQDFRAYVYLAASYLCGIPVAAALGWVSG